VLLLVGLLVVSLPLLLATRTVARLVRTLGAVDAAAIGDVIEGDPTIDLEALLTRVRTHAPGSMAERVLSAALHAEDAETPLAKKLALAEEVADIERRVVADLRVPRVAASLATSGGLLAAALVMREGLGIVIPEGADPVPIYYAVIERGLTLAGIAVFGGIACAALHRAAQQQRKARIAELDALVVPLSRRLFGEE
jgi:hypothetical protein